MKRLTSILVLGGLVVAACGSADSGITDVADAPVVTTAPPTTTTRAKAPTTATATTKQPTTTKVKRPTTTTAKAPTTTAKRPTTTTKAPPQPPTTTTAAAPPPATTASGQPPILTADHAQLGANPANRVGIAIDPVDCALPPWNLDPASAEAYYNAAIDCYHDTWNGAMAEAGFTLQRPSLWAGASIDNYDGACAEWFVPPAVAYYCGSDQQIVMPYDTVLTTAEYGPGNVLTLLTHEYGHHIQGATGMLSAYNQLRTDVGFESPAGHQLSHQLEMQAYCFAGMFYGINNGRGAITQEFTDQAIAHVNTLRTSPRFFELYGQVDNVVMWFNWGRHPAEDPNAQVTPTISECNTWNPRFPETIR